MLTILLKFNEQTLKTIETDKDVVSIGRNAGNDIHIDNLSVSKNHARIIRDKGTYQVEDLNSTNGTYLNEKMVAKAELKHKDVLTVGKHNLEILTDKLYKIDTPREQVNDTMMLTTEKHKNMLKKQKQKQKKKQKKAKK